MLRTLKYFSLVLVGLFVGVVSALKMSGLIGNKSLSSFSDVNVNNWRSDWSIGAPAANPYLRARIARHGLLALSKSEAVYLTRTVDDDGKVLNEACTYELSGTTQDVFWWSITLYDSQSRLPMNDGTALSIDATTVGDAQKWSAIIAPERPANSAPENPTNKNTHWVSSLAAGQFDLTLRMYRPSQAVLDAPETHINPPSIRRVSCLNGAGS